jgi:predicted Fe-Mo cluster-binding NifX family protein
MNRTTNMLTIAAASDHGQISQHFGHCAGYDIFKVQDGVVVATTYIPNPGHDVARPPEYLHSLGADIVIAGGMGTQAIALCNSLGMTVATGVSGAPAAAVDSYLNGTLESEGGICHGHGHAGHHGGRRR